jgi:hypothetical protein
VSSPSGSSSAPTDVEAIAAIKDAFRSRPAACGQLGSPVVEDVGLIDRWFADTRAGGSFALRLSIEVPLRAPERCAEMGQFAFIKTSRGWEFEGVFPSEPPIAPEGARKQIALSAGESTPPAGPSWSQSLLPGKWVGHFEHNGFAWDALYDISSAVVGGASGTWSIPAGGCEGNLMLGSVAGDIALLEFTTVKGRGRCLERGELKFIRQADGSLFVETQDGKGVVTRARLERR